MHFDDNIQNLCVIDGALSDLEIYARQENSKEKIENAIKHLRKVINDAITYEDGYVDEILVNNLAKHVIDRARIV